MRLSIKKALAEIFILGFQAENLGINALFLPSFGDGFYGHDPSVNTEHHTDREHQPPVLLRCNHDLTSRQDRTASSCKQICRTVDFKIEDVVGKREYNIIDPLHSETGSSSNASDDGSTVQGDPRRQNKKRGDQSSA